RRARGLVRARPRLRRRALVPIGGDAARDGARRRQRGLLAPARRRVRGGARTRGRALRAALGQGPNRLELRGARGSLLVVRSTGVPARVSRGFGRRGARVRLRGRAAPSPRARRPQAPVRRACLGEVRPPVLGAVPSRRVARSCRGAGGRAPPQPARPCRRGRGRRPRSRPPPAGGGSSRRGCRTGSTSPSESGRLRTTRETATS